MAAQSVNIVGRLHDALAYRRMCMDRVAKLFGSQFVLNGHCGFADHLCCVRSDDMAADDLVCLGIGDQLYKAVGTVHGQAASVSGEIELTDFHVPSGFSGFFYG